MGRITSVDIERARNTDITLFLNVDSSKPFCCPFHVDNKPSATIKNNLIMCQTCSNTPYIGNYKLGKDMQGRNVGRYYNTIDLVMAMYGLDVFGAVRKILGMENIKPYSPSSNGARERKSSKENYKKMLSDSRAVTQKDYFIFNFLKKRGLINCIPLLKKLNIELRTNKYKNIIYNFKGKDFAVVKGTTKPFKGALGSISYVYLTICNSKDYYVCEGIEDSLSLVLLNRNVVCLNSVANAKKLIENMTEEQKKYNYILCLDVDQKGQETTEYLIQELKAKKINVTINNKFREYAKKNGLKDVNEVFLHYCKKNKDSKMN